MNIFGKKITEIEYNDIEGLVHGKIEESTYLDYKRGISSAAEAKAELARDVSAFANTEGGTLVLGVEERRTKRGGREVFAPGAIHGVSQFRGGQETRLWLEQVMYSATRRPVNTAIQPVNIPGSQSQVFVIYVPKSNHAPHMVWSEGSKHHGRYFKRRNFQNQIAEEYEVRELFERSARLEQKLTAYLSEFNYGLRKSKTPNTYYMSFVCSPTILEDQLIDITDKPRLLLDRPTFSWPSRLHGCYIIEGGVPSPCIWGLTIARKEDNGSERALNIHRNGYMEFVALARMSEEQLTVGRWVVDCLLSFMDYSTRVLTNFQYYGNLLVIINISSPVPMMTGRIVNPIVSFYPKKAYVQIMDECLMQDLEDNVDKTLRPLTDRFFNVYGLERADCFDENGQYMAV